MGYYNTGLDLWMLSSSQVAQLVYCLGNLGVPFIGRGHYSARSYFSLQWFYYSKHHGR